MNSLYIGILYFSVILILVIISVILLIKLILSCRNRTFSKKIVIGFAVSIILLALAVLFICSHRIHYQYNDWWILNHTIDEVENRYGNFDFEIGGISGYYLYTDNGPIMPDHLEHYYYMEYDAQGNIYRVYDAGTIGG